MFDLKRKKDKKLSTHTLRYWETQFKQLKPTILQGGRRYYSAKNIEVIKMIVFLLKDEGLTIKGAIKLMNVKTKKLDETNALSVKGKYYRENIKNKSIKILNKIKNLNGKKNTH
jgi:DNA-binding transcriptional MerR regulator